MHPSRNDSIQIVAFAVPWPPNYGGAIDIFYKIKALHELGVKIHLHAFAYDGHVPSDELESYCTSVTYYPRSRPFRFLRGWPYIMASRYDRELIRNVIERGDPVIIEGFHNAFLAPILKNRGIPAILRLHNIEWSYYSFLAENESSWLKKAYFLEESRRLKKQAALLQEVPVVTLSEVDTIDVRNTFPAVDLAEVAPFHPYDKVDVPDGKGAYAIFHGNLSVNENEAAARWLITTVFSRIDYSLVIAGREPSADLVSLAESNSRVIIMANPNDQEMDKLLKEAHIHLLPNRQPTGMKLKWVSALHTARFVVAHPDMASRFDGKAGVRAVNDVGQYVDLIKELAERSFDESVVNERKALMGDELDNASNAKKLMRFLNR